MEIPIGFNGRYKNVPIKADLEKTGHICIVGGTGSGKSVCMLYILYQILKLPVAVTMYVGDFKKSGDYKGITKHFAEYEKVTDLIQNFYAEFEQTPEGNQEMKFLILDEYAGYILWLMQKDKKKCEEIKTIISNLLMLGRSRHCYVICIQQRITAQLFPSGVGAIDNFQILIGLSRLTPDSRKSLFAGQHLENETFEKNYQPKTGQGLCLIDGQPLQALQVPYIRDKEQLKRLLRKMAEKQ